MFSLYTPLASESSSIPNSSLHRGKMANEKENVYMYESCKDRILKRKNLKIEENVPKIIKLWMKKNFLQGFCHITQVNHKREFERDVALSALPSCPYRHSPVMYTTHHFRISYSILCRDIRMALLLC